jgi:pimeloyl-ACP methyl ester carboxylesterase
MSKWTSRIGFAAKIIVLVLSALITVGYLYERIAEVQDAKRFPPPGKLVDVGGRNLHLNCQGKGSPTVVIETGSGIPSFHWWHVQSELAKITRVCTYDRPGYGWSDPAPRHRSIEDRADELHTLLQKAEVAGPYIVVGHSYGGLIARLFVRKHTEQVVGVALIDAAAESVVFTPEFLELNRQSIPARRMLEQAMRFGVARTVVMLQPREKVVVSLGMPTDMIDTVGLTVAGIAPRYMSAYVDEAASLQSTPPTMRAPGAFGELGNLPLIVVEHGLPYTGNAAFMEKTWHSAQVELAQLSTRGRLITARASGHNIYADEPELVIGVIKQLITRPVDSSETYSSTP